MSNRKMVLPNVIKSSKQISEKVAEAGLGVDARNEWKIKNKKQIEGKKVRIRRRRRGIKMAVKDPEK